MITYTQFSINTNHSIRLNSKATHLKFVCSRMSHYPGYLHSFSQSIAFSGQENAELTVGSQ